ncbi:MAG: DUF3536 domain-containing protein [Sandaracinaceae bacterium]
MTRYVCIHGHFYQPPRENPWLEIVEEQPSAYPDHDWNARVSRECYRPNGHARLLDRKGCVHRIVNNYERVSFNFGPTLLSWLQAEEPTTYRAIIDADRASVERLGTGSAMAQVYNHMIMPLACSRDQRTQVRWGVADFVSRFGRAPEGMWLAETAVDTPTLETLVDEGIRFTILAPHQCARVRDPKGVWHDTRPQNVDPRRAYRVRLPSGRSIAVFFYDGSIARAVAFEGVLQDGEGLAERLTRALDGSTGPSLSHIATDGESYGHHHRFGEMALAAALRVLEERDDVEVLNYARFLQLHPPSWDAEIIEETSWSCAHGVERWRSNCGCNTGTDWHQQWRGPLREALDWLRDELAPAYEREAGRLLRDPWMARDAYIDVVLDRSAASRDRFFAAQAARDLEIEERRRALRLLELQRHTMLMYTSCGWFFDELSGIEGVQILRYAARAIELGTELFGDRFEAGFRQRLAEAKSNRPEFANGDEVFSRQVKPAEALLPKVGAHFAIGAVFDDAPTERRIGGYRGGLKDLRRLRTGRSVLATGRLRLESLITVEEETFAFAVLHLGDHNVFAGLRVHGGAPLLAAMEGSLLRAFAQADVAETLRELDQLFPHGTFGIRDLFRDEQRRILESLLEDRRDAVEQGLEVLYEQNAPLMRFLQSIGQPAPTVFRAAAEYTLVARLDRELSQGQFLNLHRLDALLREAEAEDVVLDPHRLGYALQHALESVLDALAADPEEEPVLLRAREVAAFARRSPWPVDFVQAQLTSYRLIEQLLPRWSNDGDATAARKRETLLAIAHELQLSSDVIHELAPAEECEPLGLANE